MCLFILAFKCKHRRTLVLTKCIHLYKSKLQIWTLCFIQNIRLVQNLELFQCQSLRLHFTADIVYAFLLKIESLVKNMMTFIWVGDQIRNNVQT